MGAPDLRRRFNLGLAFWLVMLAAAALFLASPLDPMNIAPGVAPAQKDLKAAIILLAPYLLVSGLGAGMGLAELASTFGEYPREAIASRWGQYLSWRHAIAAVWAVFIVKQC